MNAIENGYIKAKGTKEAYNKHLSELGGIIYFATDTLEIILDNKVYGGFDESILDSYATTEWVKGEISKIDFPDGFDPSVLIGLATEEYVDGKVAEECGKVEAKIPSLNGYATESWVEGKKYLTEHQDLSEYAKTSEVEEMIEDAKEAIVGEDLKDSLDTLEAIKQWKENHGTEYINLLETVEGKADKSDLDDYYTKEEADETFLKEHQSLEGLAKSADVYTKAEVDKKVTEAVTEGKVDLEGYATESWVEEQGYLKSHQSLTEYAKSADVTEEISEAIEGLSEVYQPIGEYLTEESLNLVVKGVYTYNGTPVHPDNNMMLTSDQGDVIVDNDDNKLKLNINPNLKVLKQGEAIQRILNYNGNIIYPGTNGEIIINNGSDVFINKDTVSNTNYFLLKLSPTLSNKINSTLSEDEINKLILDAKFDLSSLEAADGRYVLKTSVSNQDTVINWSDEFVNIATIDGKEIRVKLNKDINCSSITANNVSIYSNLNIEDCSINLSGDSYLYVNDDLILDSEGQLYSKGKKVVTFDNSNNTLKPNNIEFISCRINLYSEKGNESSRFNLNSITNYSKIYFKTDGVLSVALKDFRNYYPYILISMICKNALYLVFPLYTMNSSGNYEIYWMYNGYLFTLPISDELGTYNYEAEISVEPISSLAYLDATNKLPKEYIPDPSYIQKNPSGPMLTITGNSEDVCEYVGYKITNFYKTVNLALNDLNWNDGVQKVIYFSDITYEEGVSSATFTFMPLSGNAFVSGLPAKVETDKVYKVTAMKGSQGFYVTIDTLSK